MSYDTKEEILEAANYIAAPNDDLLVVVDLDDPTVQKQTERNSGLDVARICLVWKGRKQFLFVYLTANGFELSESGGLRLIVATSNKEKTSLLRTPARRDTISSALNVNPLKQGYLLEKS